MSTLFTKFCLLAGALVFLPILSSCARGPRPENAPQLPPPLDPERIRWEASAGDAAYEKLMAEGNRTYRIGPGDEISIALLGRPDILSGPSGEGAALFTITENPLLILPHIGSLQVHGKTPSLLEEELRAAYAQIIRDPAPVVTINRFASNQATVLGTVAEPGRYPTGEDDSLLEMIFKAGGLTWGAQTGGPPPAQILKVYRAAPDGHTVPQPAAPSAHTAAPSTRQEIIIPLDEFILGGDLSYDIPILPNDVIYIPPAGTVSVIGQTRTPRVVFLGPGLRTVSSVLTEAGGLKYKAASRIEVVRTHPNGELESFNMNARDILTRRERDFVLRDNDQIYVYTNNWRAVLDIFGNIFRASANTGVNATYSPVGP